MGLFLGHGLHLWRFLRFQVAALGIFLPGALGGSPHRASQACCVGTDNRRYLGRLFLVGAWDRSASAVTDFVLAPGKPWGLNVATP